jgi:hypothetical protein
MSVVSSKLHLPVLWYSMQYRGQSAHKVKRRDDVVLPPNGLRFTRAAPIDQGFAQANPRCNMTMIFGPHSGVGCKRGLGGTRLLSAQPSHRESH